MTIIRLFVKHVAVHLISACANGNVESFSCLQERARFFFFAVQMVEDILLSNILS